MARAKTEVIITTSYVPLPPEQVPAWRESARILLDLRDQYYHKLAAGEIEPIGVSAETAKAEKAAFAKKYWRCVGFGVERAVQSSYSGENGDLEGSREPENQPVLQGAGW